MSSRQHCVDIYVTVNHVNLSHMCPFFSYFPRRVKYWNILPDMVITSTTGGIISNTHLGTSYETMSSRQHQVDINVTNSHVNVSLLCNFFLVFPKE